MDAAVMSFHLSLSPTSSWRLTQFHPVVMPYSDKPALFKSFSILSIHHCLMRPTGHFSVGFQFFSYEPWMATHSGMTYMFNFCIHVILACIFLLLCYSSITLTVDDTDVQRIQVEGGATLRTSSPFYVGGVPPNYTVVAENVGTRTNFVGCVGDVNINNA